jgi:hypothetical protein
VRRSSNTEALLDSAIAPTVLVDKHIGEWRYSYSGGDSSMLQLLLQNVVFITIIVVPFLLFIADVIIRFSLRVDIIDAGADMSLCSVSAIVALFIEHLKIRRSIPSEVLVIETCLAMFFAVLWVVCLALISDAPFERHPRLARSWRGSIVCGLGIVSIILASYFLTELARITP